MAHYVTSVKTALTPREAFEDIADLRNLSEWDPGVASVRQVAGTGAEPDAAYDVTLGGPVGTTLRYETESFVGPRSVTLRARTWWFTSVDVISVSPAPTGGSVVTYDATLRLNGLLRLGDPAMRPVFRRIGDSAASGLRQRLGGAFVP